MKIGIIHPSLDVIGGAEQTTLHLIDILKSKYDVTLYSTTKNIETTNIKIETVERKSFPIGWSLQRDLEVKKLFMKAENEDLIFVSSGNLVLSETTKPVIIYCHSTFDSELKISNTKNTGIYKIYHNHIKKQICNRINLLGKSSVRIIANSNYTKEEIKKKFNKESVVIYPPVNLEEFDSKNKEEQIISIGRFSEEKNLEFGIDVTSKLKVRYKIFGNARFKSQLEIYHRLTNMTKNNSRISLYCNARRDLIRDEMAISKVYFHCSSETFGISVVESIAAGCIPIVPDTSAHKETVPFEELRYKENDYEDARNKLERAINGEFESRVIQLQDSIKKFSEEKFQNLILEYIFKLESDSSKEF